MSIPVVPQKCTFHLHRPTYPHQNALGFVNYSIHWRHINTSTYAVINHAQAAILRFPDLPDTIRISSGTEVGFQDLAIRSTIRLWRCFSSAERPRRMKSTFKRNPCNPCMTWAWISSFLHDDTDTSTIGKEDYTVHNLHQKSRGKKSLK